MSPSARPLVALITAGSAGLGAATARLFARSGIRCAINYANDAERAEALVRELRGISTLPPRPRGEQDPLEKGEGKGDGKEEGGGEEEEDFIAIRADLSLPSEVSALVSEAARRLGRLDVVFSNGGWTRIRGLEDLEANCDEDDWDRCFALNVKSHLWLMRAARPYLEAAADRDEGGGVLITTASMAGVVPSGSSLAYSVTKAAQIHLVKGLAVMAAPKIRVNCVSPGLMLTEWGLKFSPEAQQKSLERTKLKRLVTVEDVAEQVLCFVRSKTVTGANAIIDAGFSL